jgi:predicted DNA-binding transcriptional regulator AlpA
MSAQRSERLVDAHEAAALFGCSERHMVDRVCKRPGFPSPVKLRPLLWAEWRVLEYRDTTPVLPPVRRRSRRSKT